MIPTWPIPAEEDRCALCGDLILPSPDYVLTDDFQGRFEWWHGDCRLQYLLDQGDSSGKPSVERLGRYEANMTFGIVAFHYPKDEYREAMIQRVRRAAEGMATVRGCIEAVCWQEEATGVVVAIGKWETKDDCLASFRAIAEANIDFDYDDRESRPREIFNLTECRTPASQ